MNVQDRDRNRPGPRLAAAPRRRALRIALSLLLFPAGSPLLGETPADESPRDDEVVAAWHDGRITRAEYTEWLAAEGLEDGPEAVREMVYVRSMASSAEERLDARGKRRLELELEAQRGRLLLPALRRHVIQSAPPIEKEELEALRLAHPGAFVQPRKLRLRNLFKAVTDPEEAPAVRSAMAEIHKKLVDGADFEELARLESESQTRFRGGRLGLVDPEELPAPLAEAVRDLEPGKLSPPIEHPGGITLFLCEEIRPARNPTPEQVRAKLRTNLERQRAQRLWADYQSRLIEGMRLDLSVIPRPESAKGAAVPAREPGPVLTMPGHRLDLDDLRLLVDLRIEGRELEDLGVDELEDLLHRWAVSVAGTRRAMELGLDEDPEIAGRLHGLRTEILARGELVRRVDEQLEEPDEAELRQWLEAHPGRYREILSYDVAAIHFGESPDLAMAREVERRVASGELSFEEAARRYSEHPSASEGGRLGRRTPADLVQWGATAAKALRTLENGATTDLLHLESGLWIFQLLERHEARPSTFEEALPRIRRDRRAQQIGELEQAVRAEQLKAVGFEPSPAEPVVVRWSTASEHECFGYHVYRAEHEDGPFERLTDEVVAGGGTTDLPRRYRFEDPSVEVGKTYYYYVETVSTDGSTERLTPVRAVQVEARNPAPTDDPG